MNDIIIYILLCLLILFALLTVIIKDSLKAVISLAVASAMLTTILFGLDAPLAAVFELSVCAGLITVIFVAVISLTKAAAPGVETDTEKRRYIRYLFLPLILIVVAIILLSVAPLSEFVTVSKVSAEDNVREVLWNIRRLDILGQIIMILAGVFGVVILFKGNTKK